MLNNFFNVSKPNEQRKRCAPNTPEKDNSSYAMHCLLPNSNVNPRDDTGPVHVFSSKYLVM